VIRIQITDGAALKDEAAWLSRLRCDVDFIQVREPDASARDLARLVRAAMRIAPVLVNERADVAIACGAAGVHLRAGSIAAADIRRLASTMIVTVSCHCEEEVEAAQGADYVVLAPIFAPLSKADARTPLGVDTLREICAAYRTPVIALGGITTANALECVAAGAAGVAGITLFRPA
jgi:thiamine-phosphate pyrophosphorylase